jgi:hypothetical protein
MEIDKETSETGKGLGQISGRMEDIEIGSNKYLPFGNRYGGAILA